MNPDFEKIKKALGILRAILLRICALIALAGALVLARSAVNAVFLHLYSTGNYAVFPENLLIYLPFGENYVVPYNLGNAQFQHGNYEKAIYYYTLAWQNDPPAHPEHDEECRIRVNLAFSMCHTIDWDNLDRSDKEAVEKVVTTLQIARAYLTEHECASEPVGSDDGHYRDADLLKHDIDRMLEQLAQSQSEGGGDGGGGQNDDQNDQGGGGQDDQNKDQNEEDKQDQSRQQSAGNKDEEVERARQEKLKEDLEQQKRDLEERSASPSGYEYIDGGKAQGYGDGTLW